MEAWAVLPLSVFYNKIKGPQLQLLCLFFQNATHSNVRPCSYLINLFRCILYNIKANKPSDFAIVWCIQKKVTPFWEPETTFLQHDQLFNSELSTLSRVHEYWTQSLPSHTFRRSKALHVSQSFSSSITREFQKETEEEMGSVTAEYTPADILFLCKISLLFDGHKCLRDTRPIPYRIYISPHFCQTAASFWSNIYCAAVKMSGRHGFFKKNSFCGAHSFCLTL